MMTEAILSAIRDYEKSGSVRISDWRLVRTESSGRERYFVGSALEQARAVDTDEYKLTLYVDSESGDKKFRGESTVTIRPTDTAAELAATVARSAFAASKSRNPWFSLPGPATAKVSLPASAFDAGETGSHLDAVRDALYSPPSADDGGAGDTAGDAAGNGTGAAGMPGAEPAATARINSLELFLRREKTHFLNSRGQKWSSTRNRGYTEFVVEATGPGVNVELFDDLHFSEPDRVRLAGATGNRLSQVLDRAKAIPMPALDGIPVLLSGAEAEEVFGWFFDNARTDMVFSKASSFSVGMNVQSPESGGADAGAKATAGAMAVADPLDLRAEAVLKGMPSSTPFDPDGFPLEPVDVISGGILQCLTGSVRHADWLGVPRKGSFPLFSVSPGRATQASLRAAPHLEPVMFSDFRLDTVTGAFGAEIRLAYWFDGVKRVPVTGGSISGTVGAVRASMRRSAELRLGARSLCPVAVLLQGVSITGIA